MASGILQLNSVTVGRRLQGVSLTLEPQRPIVFVGPNGAGKSTLVRAVAGLERPTSGQIRIDGHWSSDPRARAAHVAWLPQHPRLEEGLTALDVVAAGRFRFEEPRAEALVQARRSLQAYDAGAWEERQMSRLSGGEAQRVRLAALHAQDASWWLLDEPFNHLDPGVRLRLLERVAQRARDQGGVVLVTHDLSLLPWMQGARVIGMEDGRIVYDGAVGDPELPAAVGPLLGVRVAEAEVDGHLQYVVTGAA